MGILRHIVDFFSISEKSQLIYTLEFCGVFFTRRNDFIPVQKLGSFYKMVQYDTDLLSLWWY